MASDARTRFGTPTSALPLLCRAFMSPSQVRVNLTFKVGEGPHADRSGIRGRYSKEKK